MWGVSGAISDLILLNLVAGLTNKSALPLRKNSMAVHHTPFTTAAGSLAHVWLPRLRGTINITETRGTSPAKPQLFPHKDG